MNPDEQPPPSEKTIGDLQAQLDRKNKEIKFILKISAEINASLDMDSIAAKLLASMDEIFGFQYSMILLLEKGTDILRVVATHGYRQQGIGSTVKMGQGVIGVVAQKKRLLRISGMQIQQRYLQRAMLSAKEMAGETDTPLPTLTKAQSQIAIPMLSKNDLVGVLSVESRGLSVLNKQDEVLVSILANQAAVAFQNARLNQSLRDANSRLQEYSDSLEHKVVERTEELSQTLENLRATQSQLIQSEKMAALGQLIAGIAHEINTPLGAINASIGNISHALEDSLRQLPQLLQQLSSEQQGEFFAMVDAALQNKTLLTSREERKLRRALRNDLEDQAVAEADVLADMLVEMGLHDGIEPYLPLLRADNATSMLQSAYNLVSQQRNSLNIKTAVERASKIVFALKSYARQDHRGDKVEANIPDSLDTVLTLYHNQLKQGVDVIKQYDDVPPIHCYADELNQVWTNLVHNALQAMEYRGVLEIEVKRLEIGDWRLEDKENGSPHLPISSSPHYLSVSITDSGPGIPDEIKGRIFDPFFTTKPAGEGSGLGLDIVRKIVEKHEGQIDFESEPGRTTFRVLLPLEIS